MEADGLGVRPDSARPGSARPGGLPGDVGGALFAKQESPVLMSVVPTLGMRRRSSVAEAVARDPTALAALAIDTSPSAQSLPPSVQSFSPKSPCSPWSSRLSTAASTPAESLASRRGSLLIGVPGGGGAAEGSEASPPGSTRGSLTSQRGSLISGVSAAGGGEDVARFDVCTLRTWFDMIDRDGSGGIDKQEWLDFLRENPRLDRILIRGQGEALSPRNTDKDSLEAFLQGKDDAVQIRRRLKTWRDIDKDGSGTLDWDEFVDFFRRTGNLLELEPQSPRYRIYELARAMKEEPGCVTNEDVAEYKALAAKHLTAAQRSYVTPEVAQKLSQHSPSGSSNGPSFSAPGTSSLMKRRQTNGLRILGGSQPLSPAPASPAPASPVPAP